MPAVSTWDLLTKQDLERKLSRALHMLSKIAGDKEVWTISEVKKVIKAASAGKKDVNPEAGYTYSGRSKIKLAPCPFCGGDKVQACDKMLCDSSHIPEKTFWYKCKNCGAASSEQPSRDRAAKAWNKRCKS